MKYCRIDLSKTNYEPWTGYAVLNQHSRHRLLPELRRIYQVYCEYKKFDSVMPVFDSQFLDVDNDVIGYYRHDQLIAWSLCRRYDQTNVESIQFAWNYSEPELYLGLRSVETECAIYRNRGFQYLYLGIDSQYKRQFDGYELIKNTNV